MLLTNMYSGVTSCNMIRKCVLLIALFHTFLCVCKKSQFALHANVSAVVLIRMRGHDSYGKVYRTDVGYEIGQVWPYMRLVTVGVMVSDTLNGAVHRVIPEIV